MNVTEQTDKYKNITRQNLEGISVAGPGISFCKDPAKNFGIAPMAQVNPTYRSIQTT